MPKGMGITVDLIDVNQSFKRLFVLAPKLLRTELHDTAVEPTTVHVFGRMHANAPVNPETAPHMKDALEFKTRGLVGQAGIFDNDWEAHVALWNEYRPNSQPFMVPAAESESSAFAQRATKALKNVERLLTV